MWHKQLLQQEVAKYIDCNFSLLYTKNKATDRVIGGEIMARTKLINLRRMHGLTQQEIADKLKVTRSFYGMIETGDRNPTLDLAKKIAEMFNANIEDIFFEEKYHELLQYPSHVNDEAITTEAANQ
jgi:putative transcriptional regulator